jgi:DNA repair protein RadC
MDEMRFKKVELVKVLILNSKNYVLKILDLSIGGTNFAQVSIKNTLSEAIKMQAPKIILVHNHPTGDSTPSSADIEFTEKLEKGAKMLDIQLLDHIVIGNGQYTSIFALKKQTT